MNVKISIDAVCGGNQINGLRNSTSRIYECIYRKLSEKYSLKKEPVYSYASNEDGTYISDSLEFVFKNEVVLITKQTVIFDLRTFNLSCEIQRISNKNYNSVFLIKNLNYDSGLLDILQESISCLRENKHSTNLSLSEDGIEHEQFYMKRNFKVIGFEGIVFN